MACFSSRRSPWRGLGRCARATLRRAPSLRPRRKGHAAGGSARCVLGASEWCRPPSRHACARAAEIGHVCVCWCARSEGPGAGGAACAADARWLQKRSRARLQRVIHGNSQSSSSSHTPTDAKWSHCATMEALPHVPLYHSKRVRFKDEVKLCFHQRVVRLDGAGAREARGDGRHTPRAEASALASRRRPQGHVCHYRFEDVGRRLRHIAAYSFRLFAHAVKRRDRACVPALPRGTPRARWLCTVSPVAR